MATILDLADAVVTVLNTPATFSQAFTALRKYKPEYTLEDFATLRVTVCPGENAWETVTRAATQNDYTLTVGVQKKIDTDSAAVMDPLMTLVEEIRDAMMRRAFTSPRCTCIEGSFGPGSEKGYSEEHRDEYRLFTALLTFTFRKVG